LTQARTTTLRELAAALGGQVDGDPETPIWAATGLEDAHEGSVVRVEDRKYLQPALDSPAAAVLAPPDLEIEGKPAIRVTEVRLAFAQALRFLHPEAPAPPGVHPTAAVHPSATVDPTAAIGPFAVVGPECVIGPRSVVHAHAVLIEDVVVGEDCVLFPHVVLYAQTRLGARVRLHSGVVLGADGFGYVWTGREHYKIPQVGGVVIEDDVEIGANTTIDCGTTSDTLIGAGTKIDNQVQIGHNVQTGRFCTVIAQVGIGGSAQIGQGVLLAGKAGVKDHVSIGEGTIVGGLAGVWSDLPANGRFSGFPARSHTEELRFQAGVRRLPDLLKRVRELEKRLDALTGEEER
jgi:UDP-3-O-[3-hydroxymyristoyl] glucosamine N-acyltransferase